MRLKLARMVLALMLVIGAGALVDFLFFPPTYQGHTAAWWLDHVNDGFNEAEQAFQQMGAPAVRYLGLTAAAGNLLHSDSTEQRQKAALRMLYDLGSNAAPALPSLVSLFRRRAGLSYAAASVLTRLPPSQIEFLTPELIADLPRAQRLPKNSELLEDIRLLHAIGPKAKAATPALLSIVQTGDDFTSSDATVALWDIGHDTNMLLAALSNSFGDHGTREYVLLLKCDYWNALPPPVVPLLQRALRHPQPAVRNRSGVLLEKIDPARFRQVEADLNARQDELLQNHLDLLQSTNALDRKNAAEALAFFGPRATPAVPRLVEILGFPAAKPWANEKPAAFFALKSIGSNAAVATPRLIGLLEDSHSASFACDILANIGPPAAPALPALRALLATNYVESTNKSLKSPRLIHKEIVPRWKVAQALASINPGESNAVAILREAAIMPRNHFRSQNHVNNNDSYFPAAITLWKLGLSTNSPVDALIAQGGEAVIDLLGDIGPAATKAVPLVEEALNRASYDRSAALALTHIDSVKAARVGLPGFFIICPDKY